MQDRKFVLLPIQDLNLDWKHPVLKRVSQSYWRFLQIRVCGSRNFENHYKVLHWSNSIMLHLKEILGKTTLATKIAEDFNAKTVLERRQSLSTKVL
jgi:hypothetical protein